LLATGSYHARNFAKASLPEIGRHGDYIKTVVLNSPGGSVADALAMGRLIRERKIRNRGRGGEKILRLILSSGVRRRRRAPRRPRGHRSACIRSRRCRRPPNQAPRDDEMKPGAKISRRALPSAISTRWGVSLQVWVHAMETPHDRLFVFKPDELKSLNLVTNGGCRANQLRQRRPRPIFNKTSFLTWG